MTSDRLRGFLQLGIFALVFLSPLPFGSVRPASVLAIELIAAIIGLTVIVLITRDRTARVALPPIPMAACAVLLALGALQIFPLPFSFADRFNPTAELMRPLIPHLGLDHPPTVSWTIAPPETTDALLRLFAYMLIALGAHVAFNDEPSRRRLAVVLVGSAVFQAVYGSGEYLSGRQHVFAYAKKYYLDSATGTFINRNHVATFLAVALPFALVLAIPGDPARSTKTASWRHRIVAATNPREFGRLLAIGAAALIWLGLLLTHSRAGLVAAIVGATLVLVRFRSRRAARWTAAIGTGVLLVLMTIDLAQSPGERFFTLGDEITGRAGRPAVWRDAMGLVRARPLLGWGFGTFESAFPMVHSADIDLHFDHAHSDWLEWATEGGAIAFAMALMLLTVVIRRTALATVRSDSPERFPAACQAAIVALALHAAWDFSLRIPAVAVVGATLMGLALSFPSMAPDPVRTGFLRPRGGSTTEM